MESKPWLAKLDRIVRFLNTVNGTDKTLMVSSGQALFVVMNHEQFLGSAIC
jgi:hypothetical protein